MKVVASGFGLRGDQACDCLAELRVESLRDHLHLRYRVNVRVDHGDAVDGFLVVGAVELITGGKGAALDFDGFAALRITASLRRPPPDVRGARRQQFKGGELRFRLGKS